MDEGSGVLVGTGCPPYVLSQFFGDIVGWAPRAHHDV